MATTNHYEIPDGLSDLLRDFTVAVLRQKPRNLYDFAAEHFAKTRDARRANAVPMYIVVDDEDAREPDPSVFKPKTIKQNRSGRRHSVSAERYDPEEDDGEEAAVHAKDDTQRARLVEAVAGILLFRSLDSDQMSAVIDAMFERKVVPGEYVIRQGDDGDNFYVIDSGTYDVLVSPEVSGSSTAPVVPRRVHRFEERGSFGELALLYNMPRSASVVAVQAGTLWAMDRASFRRILLKSAFKKRKMYEKLLESVPMLQSLESYERLNIADALTSSVFEDGACIIREGAEADGMYFIEDGLLKVTITKDGRETEVAQVANGKYFGEMALVENTPRSASVYAAGRVKVAFLERKCFERMLGPCLDIMKRNITTYQMSS